jgi:hypothetical protein
LLGNKKKYDKKSGLIGRNDQKMSKEMKHKHRRKTRAKIKK